MKLIRLALLLTCLAAATLSFAQVPPLPEPVANNAVAQINTKEGRMLVSLMGLGEGKTYKDVHDKVWTWREGEESWQQKTSVPSSLALKGRLASIAVGVGEHVYVFGGYTVAQDHTEISSPDNFRYDPIQDKYTKIAETPVAVDDAIALLYQNNFIYLISGWHNDGNVNLVQVYDIQNNRWSQASPFVGDPVFGHAGGIVGNKLVVCDGVAVKAQYKARRNFRPISECYYGEIDPKNISKIGWQKIKHPTNIGRYRMAATGIQTPRPGIVFIGGAANPYNYNGIGYDGIAARPAPQVWFYDLEEESWTVHTYDESKGTMDHRGLLQIDDTFLLLGGMNDQQQVLKQVTTLPVATSIADK